MTSLKVEFGGYTNAGIKEQNQDAFAAQSPTGSLLTHKGAIATIADGLSSSANAQLAARTCASSFVTDYLATPETWGVERAAAKIVRSLNSWCYAQGTPELGASSTENDDCDGSGNMLTTLSSIIFKSCHGHIFHVGDSRVYRWQDNSLEQLTRDHKQHQGKQSFLYRAVGVDSHIDVDYIKVKLQRNDLLMLSTDGVHDFITKNELSNLLSMQHISLEVKAQSIVAQALKNGSDDNLSCLLVNVLSLGEVDIEENHRQLSQFAIPPALEIGNIIEGYKVLEVLFSGTRSYLYKVLSQKDKLTYVLKAPSQNFQDDLVYLRGFSQEQWIGQHINHANVMKILPRAADSQFMYHVCEFIEGQTLRQWMIDNPLPSLEQVRSILKPVTAALRCMQRLDMIHRDLKPENIMLSHQGEVKLIDFGTIQVAALTELHSEIEGDTPVGSVNYVAPEYLLSNRCEHVSDIFSLGVIAYEMLTNSLPYKPFMYKDYRPKSLGEWNYIPIHQTKCKLPLWVDMALRKSTEPNPNNRYQALSEFITDLQQPSQQHLMAIENAPLLERNPLLFWKILCGLLIAANIYQMLPN
jgi:serine/threonine protein phosphatase PrpC